MPTNFSLPKRPGGEPSLSPATTPNRVPSARRSWEGLANPAGINLARSGHKTDRGPGSSTALTANQAKTPAAIDQDQAKALSGPSDPGQLLGPSPLIMDAQRRASEAEGMRGRENHQPAGSKQENPLLADAESRAALHARINH